MKKHKAAPTKAIVVGSGNVVSQFFFLWVFRFIWVLRRSKDLKDLIFLLRETETSEYNDELLEAKWSVEKERAAQKKTTPRIRTALFKTFGVAFALNGIFKILWGIALWTGAYWLLKVTVSYVRSKSSDVVQGQMYALGFLISSVFATIFIQQLLSQSGRLGLRVATPLYSASSSFF